MGTLPRAFANSDFVGVAVCVILLAVSFFALAKMVGKIRAVWSAKNRNKMFKRLYKKTQHPAQLFQQSQGRFRDGIPLAGIYSITIKELTNFLHRSGVSDEEIAAWQPGLTGPALPESEMATVRAAAESALSESILSLESDMTFLATCTSAAPSLGLFGTVWGIMCAFMDMVSSADGGATMIQAVAPGISSALLTTVVGLFVAIPTSIVYNFLSANIREQTVELENFTDMLIADIVRLHGSSTSGQKPAFSSWTASAVPQVSSPSPLPPSPSDRV